MKLLHALLQEAKNAEMDPSQVTASDVSAYVRQVKSALKGKKVTKSMVGSAVRDIAEDDPKFGAHPAALPKLVAAVCAKLCESADVAQDEDEEEGVQPAKFSASTPKPELEKQKKYLQDQLKLTGDNRALHIRLKLALKKIEGFLGEGWDQDDDEDPDVKAADDEARKRKIKLMSPRAEQALTKKLSKADKKDEDKAAKKVDESIVAEGIDVDELSVSEIEAKFRAAIKTKYPAAGDVKVHMDGKEMRAEKGDKCFGTLSLETGKVTYLGEGWDDDDEDPDVKAADDEARKRKIKLMSPRAEQALARKFAKADKKDEDKAAKKVDESTEVVAAEKEEALKKPGRFAQSLMDAQG